MLRLSRTPLDANNKDGNEAASDGEKASPASRLRAAMSRLGPSGSPQRPVAPPSESDSDLNPVFSARKSLKDVFSRAMRDNNDSPNSKASSSIRNIDKEEEEPDSQLSDSSLPMSSQAASLQLLRHRLEIPEMSSRMDASRSTAKPSHSHQDLHHLLHMREEGDPSDVSLDTARPASPPAQTTSSRSVRVSTPTRRAGNSTNPVRGTPSPPNGVLDLPAPPTSDPETDSSYALPMVRTPKPPGGWFTPTRGKGSVSMLDSPTTTSALGQTPAPPGAWKGTPAPPQARKGILKASNQRDSVNLNDMSESEDIESASPMGVTLVDSFGRARKFDENGDEMALPPVGDPQETRSRRQNASVRLVDNMGNELDPSSLASQEASSDIGEYDNASLVAKIEANITNLTQGFEKVEARHESLRIRQVGKQAAIPHERILQLAMDSRGARIERERLLRQSHFVRARKEELSAQLLKLQARPLLTPQVVETRLSPHMSRGLIVLLFFLPLLLLAILYICARAYVRHYFLTSYYDPFFATVDPASLHRIPFVQLIQLPCRWDSFAVQRAGQAILSRLSGVEGVSQHVMTLVSKPLTDLDIKLPS